jgi:hypothetical protein
LSAVSEPSVPTTIVLNIQPPLVRSSRTVVLPAAAGKLRRVGE